MRFLWLLGLIYCSFIYARPGDGRSITLLKSQLEKRLRGESGLYAVAFKDLQTGETLFIREQQMMHAASTMKVAVMIEVFRQAHLGHFHLDDSLQIINQFKSLVDEQPFSIDIEQDHDDPVVQAIGRSMTVRELVEHMIIVSSNLATNLLMELVGAKNVQATVRQLGAEQMEILRGVEDNLAYEKGLNNRTNAYDLLVLFEAIATSTAVSPEACDQMTSILLQQKFNDKIPARLPPEVRVAHKTGSITRINHDAGFVLLPDRRKYALAILSQGVDNPRQSSAVIAELSYYIYQWMNEKR